MVADAERRVTNTGLEDIIGTSGTDWHCEQ